MTQCVGIYTNLQTLQDCPLLLRELKSMLTDFSGLLNERFFRNFYRFQLPMV